MYHFIWGNQRSRKEKKEQEVGVIKYLFLTSHESRVVKIVSLRNRTAGRTSDRV